ncbi:MAG: DUF5916 domain-containing protein, partial [Vicinamibacterales bacterium]
QQREAVVTRATGPIVLDGALDEADWRTAPPIGELVQRQPRPGTEPSERTQVTVLRDDANLYIGVLAFDSEPEAVLGSQMARDGGLGSDDRIEVLLDTFRDQRNAFYFATNPDGTLLDGLAFANGELNNDWDAIWDVRTRRTADGWSAEFAIPFKSLSFPADSRAWGFNVARTIQRKLEEARWSGARLETRFLQVSEAGELASIGAASQGLGLDIRPFLAGSQLHLGRTGTNDFNGKPGVDVFYNITSSLKLSATVNTDFGETEVDARTINLTRFSVLFPEKRSFFLEDAGVFTFASTGPTPAAGIPGTGAEVFPFFSRQIGLLNGREVPVDVGLKFTGKAGRTDIGVLDVRTGDFDVDGRDSLGAKNLFVGRVKRNLFEQSYIGAVITDGNPALPTAGRTVGADLRLATSRFLGASRNFVVDAYGVRSVNEDRRGRDWSYGMSAYYPNDKYSAQVVIREIQENFRPAMGFVQRDNVRLFRAAFSYNPRPRNFLNLQQMFHDFYYTQFTNLTTGELESADFYMTVLDWHVNTGDNFHGLLDVNRVYERLFEPFTISPGVILPVGEYRFTRFKSNLFNTAARRNLSGNLTITWGDYWSGTAEQVTAGVTFKIPPRFTLSLNTNQTFAKLPEGHFTARIYTSTINYTQSPRLAVSNLVQFDNRSKNLGWQGRLRWTIRPGDDVFFVVNQGWIQETGERVRFRAMDRKISAKVQYAFGL